MGIFGVGVSVDEFRILVNANGLICSAPVMHCVAAKLMVKFNAKLHDNHLLISLLRPTGRTLGGHRPHYDISVSPIIN